MLLYLDGKQKAIIPTENTKSETFKHILEAYIHQNWEEFHLIKQSNKQEIEDRLP